MLDSMQDEQDYRIVDFFRDYAGVDMSEISRSDPLFSSGLVDSMTLIELLAFLEAEFGVEVSMADLRLDDIDTLDGISSYISGSR
ncbi:hypothetical protein HKCCE3408_06545 [Rhodobacterales bacterium HKCCE3408]|nr:hypothetical protein [Rhodobacterales bacterium HKCCE3408]